MRKAVISGATGFIGKAVTTALVSRDWRVVKLTRNTRPPMDFDDQRVAYAIWNARSKGSWVDELEGVDAIIHLAGENIADGFWTKAKKNSILMSRIQSGEVLSDAVACIRTKPRVFIQASGIGYYGARRSLECDEETTKGSGFLAEVVERWENSTEPIDKMGIRRCIIRTGMVLGTGGGFVSKSFLPFRFNIGAYIGNASDWISWIHLKDHVGICLKLIDDPNARGIFNLTSPGAVQLGMFYQLLAKKMNSPFLIRIPPRALRFLPGGFAQEVFMTDQIVRPKKILNLDYKFEYELIEDALNQIIACKTF